jgi:hypothetical protein
VKKLRGVSGNEWSRIADPVKEFVEQRHGSTRSRKPK